MMDDSRIIPAAVRPRMKYRTIAHTCGLPACRCRACEGNVCAHLWNEKVLSNYCCKTCGIFTCIADGENAKDGYRVNLGCVEGLDPLALAIRDIDGKSLPLVGEGR
jgi:hypothetical protein